MTATLGFFARNIDCDVRFLIGPSCWVTGTPELSIKVGTAEDLELSGVLL